MGFGHHRDHIREEAREIAGELDRGHANQAAEHLRRELSSHGFQEQKRLVELIDHYDRKGLGADLQVHCIDRRNGVWDDIRIVQPRPVYVPPPCPPPGRYPQPCPPPRDVHHPVPPRIDIIIDIDLFKRR